MRTTLEIDDRVLAAARSLARAEHVSVGRAVSLLALRGLGTGGAGPRLDVASAPFPVLVGDPEHPVTDELVGRFRDDE